jgi:hypothetical protein
MRHAAITIATCSMLLACGPSEHAPPAGDAVDESVGLGRRGRIHARVVAATSRSAKSDRRKP